MNEMDIDFCMLLFSCSQHAQLHTSITSTYIKNIFLMLHLLLILFTRPFSIALQGVCSTGYIITAAGLLDYGRCFSRLVLFQRAHPQSGIDDTSALTKYASMKQK
jgi:hypothetical protein